MKSIDRPYIEQTINTRNLIIPRESYQRELSHLRVKKIVEHFDEKIANEPKVSFRNGRYYVFDGQHTIEARKQLAGGNDVNVVCKVYTNMSEVEEADLFAQQFGASAPLTAGAKLRALIFSGDPESMLFLRTNELAGVTLDYGHSRGYRRIGCIATALDEYRRMGADKYTEAILIILDAWGGDPESLRAETIQGICRFVDLYHDEFDRKRLIRNLHRKDPLTIYREGRAAGVSLAGYKRYLAQVFYIYNGTSRKNALPVKF